MWREADSNLTWLAAAPLLQLESDPTVRKAYSLDWEEQQLLFSDVNTRVPGSRAVQPAMELGATGTGTGYSRDQAKCVRAAGDECEESPGASD